jgi:putative hydrolase of the HAD superfamily
MRAVLFDVGGPLDTEVIHERMIDTHIRSSLASAGLKVSDAAYAEACQWAVESFAPNAYQAIIWRLTAGNPLLAQRIYANVVEHASQLSTFELREGMDHLLARLRLRGLKLGLAANQPETTLHVLDAAGIGRFFDSREVSGSHGYRKPDVRLFLRAAESLQAKAAECIMVGDRIDNDIVPAKLLGMRTVLFRTGRHRDQSPRSWEELPDRQVYDVAGLDLALRTLLR